MSTIRAYQKFQSLRTYVVELDFVKKRVGGRYFLILSSWIIASLKFVDLVNYFSYFFRH